LVISWVLWVWLWWGLLWGLSLVSRRQLLEEALGELLWKVLGVLP
jgi:hypothetical protein